MGIDNSANIIFKADSFVSRELVSALDHMSDDSSSRSASQTKRIDCDVSNIIHDLSYKHARVYSTKLVREVANFLKLLSSDSGFIVTAILDGDVRPQSKRDAFKRRYNSTMNRINSYYCRQMAMKIASKPVNEMTSAEKKRLDLFNNEAKALESSSRMTVPSDFMEQLDSALVENGAYIADRKSGGYVSRQIIKAEFEADYIMAYRYRKGLSNLVYSTDSDMSALCGPSCISIRYFGEEKDKEKKKNKRKNDNETSSQALVYNISGGSNVIMQKMKTHVESTFPNNMITFEEAKYPLLDNTNPLTLGLTVVGLGCDVLPGGVSGVTAKGIWSEIEKKKKKGITQPGQIFKHLIKYYQEKDTTGMLQELDLLTLTQAFLYQPALEFGKKEDSSAYKYIFNKPNTLPTYLKMFLPPNVSVEEDEDEVRDTIRCNGIQGINASHDFLKAEGHFTCSSCQRCFCKFCGYSPKKDRDGKKSKKFSFIHYQSMNDDLCVDCYKERVFLPFSSSLDDALNITEMKKFLKDNNQSIPADAKAYEIQEIFEMCKVDLSRKANIDETVPYPLYESKSLDITEENNNKKRFGFGKVLHTFPLAEGGLFISDTHSISNAMVIPVINLMANIVRYNPNQKKYTSYNSPVYDVLPSIFIEFANGSRASSGFRLLKFCLRHAFDPKAFPIMEQNATLFIHGKDGEIGIVLENRIGASMKDVEYNVTLALTSNDLLASQCECQAGGENDERVLCVHGLPLLYQLSMLMDDGLAEHLLVELCSRWNTDLEDEVEKQGKHNQIKKTLLH